MTFALPALGRLANGAFGASMYPDTPNITLDGSGPDALNFGPESFTEGAGLFEAVP